MDKIGDNAYVVKLKKDGRYIPVNVSRMYQTLRVNADRNRRPGTASARRHARASRKLRKRLVAADQKRRKAENCAIKAHFKQNLVKTKDKKTHKLYVPQRKRRRIQ
ncbi:MAG: hypothetical protein GY928_02360 [Colwellia sp.]|nr:hypothetical protein [Colwellia sp.]